MNNTSHLNRLRLTLVISITLLYVPAYGQQPPTSLDRDRAHVMLQAVKNDLKNNYYDLKFHGMDVDARFKAADEKLKEATSLAQLFGVIAQALDDLGDSHTFFLPPSRAYRTEYGWQMQMIGTRCYVVAVKPGSDAETKGLQPGDEVYAIDGIGPVRENIWKIQYLYRSLRPRAGMRLVVIKPDGRQLQLDVLAQIQQGKREYDLTGSLGRNDLPDLIREAENESRLNRHRYIEKGNDLFIWKMPSFDMTTTEVDSFVDKFRKDKALILDLRGNSGGYEETLLRLLANVFDHDIKVGDLKRRKETKPLLVKSRGNSAFTGKITVLIDSGSASAAELFARVIQLEKRGTVIGDRSSGAVMRSIVHDHQVGLDVVVPYGVSITDADITMTDGNSLEHVGVTPDEIKLPTALDLARKHDSALAYAAGLFGVAISPEEAGAMFPIEWKK